jgi:hypothetical protein
MKKPWLVTLSYYVPAVVFAMIFDGGFRYGDCYRWSQSFSVLTAEAGSAAIDTITSMAR